MQIGLTFAESFSKARAKEFARGAWFYVILPAWTRQHIHVSLLNYNVNHVGSDDNLLERNKQSDIRQVARCKILQHPMNIPWVAVEDTVPWVWPGLSKQQVTSFGRLVRIHTLSNYQISCAGSSQQYTSSFTRKESYQEKEASQPSLVLLGKYYRCSFSPVLFSKQITLHKHPLAPYNTISEQESD